MPTRTNTPRPPRNRREQLVAGLISALREQPRADGADASERLAGAVLLDATRERASDVHFEPCQGGVVVRLRIDGVLYDTTLLGHDEGMRVIRHFKAVAGIDPSQHLLPIDARVSRQIDGRTVDCRLASVRCVAGEALAVRLMDRPRIEQRIGELGLSAAHHGEIAGWLDGASGIFLVVGPTGSGKSTTLYALLRELRERDHAVYTIEDPVEQRVDGVVQMQVDRRHGLTFADGLRTMLRLDPDQLLLGEIRDPDAARAVAEVAGSGRVIMSTMSGADAVGAVTTLRALGMADREIAAGLHCVVAQRLLRRLCTRCRRRRAAAGGRRPGNSGDGGFWDAPGCDECRGLGYAGQVGAFEVWQVGPHERAAILSQVSEMELRKHLLSRGYQTVLHDAMNKARAGVTSVAEVRRIAANYPATEIDPSIIQEWSAAHSGPGADARSS